MVAGQPDDRAIDQRKRCWWGVRIVASWVHPSLPQSCDDRAGGRGEGLTRHNPGLVPCVRPVGRCCGHHWPSTGRATVT